MAFGFPAYHEEELITPFPISDEWIAHTAMSVGWEYHTRTPDPRFGWVWRVGVTISVWSWGASLLIWPTGPQQVRIRSECALPTQCIDWGSNRRNVETFANALVTGMNAAMQGPSSVNYGQQ